MYTLNYNTGAGNTIHKTIEEAMGAVEPCYTQQNITIEDEQGNILYIAHWCDGEYDPNAECNNYEDSPSVLVEFGTFGYYLDFVEY